MQIIRGNKSTFRASVYAPPEEEDVDYLREMMESDRELIADVGSRYRSRVSELFETINSSSVLYRARTMYRRSQNFFKKDRIEALTDLIGVRTAKSEMRSYIMAMPEVRELYHRQLIDGYSGYYKDEQPGIIGLGHKEYDQARNGVLYTTDDEMLRFDLAMDVDIDPSLQLSIEEQQDIECTYDYIRRILKDTREDPTCLYGGERGG